MRVLRAGLALSFALLATACSQAPVPDPVPTPAVSSAAPGASTTPMPAKVTPPKRTKQERARTTINNDTTAHQFFDSTKKAVKKDQWIVVGACVTPATQKDPASMAWSITRSKGADTTSLDVLEAGSVTCDGLVHNIGVKGLGRKPVQLDVSTPLGDVRSGYLILTARP